MVNTSSSAHLPLAVPTALHDDGAFDPDGQAALAAAVAEAGADAVSILDLTAGEVAQLSDDERVAVLVAVRRGAGSLPVLAGTGPPGPDQLGSARRLVDAGADVLVLPVGRTAGSLVERVGQVAALGIPLIVHHHPGVTGASIDPGDLGALAREVGARAVLHEGVPVPDAVATLVAGDVTVLGGLGGLFLPEELDAGAHGTAAATAVPEQLAEVAGRHRADDRGTAREQHLLASGYLRLEAGSAGVVVRKEAWRQRGSLRSGRVRRGVPLGPVTKAAIRDRLRELGVDLREPWPGG